MHFPLVAEIDTFARHLDGRSARSAPAIALAGLSLSGLALTGAYWGVGLAGTNLGRRVSGARLLARVPTREGTVALTFDDGPDPAFTQRFIDALGETSCTFFVLGERARQWPVLVRRLVGAGHELGCHGYRHDRLSRLSPRATIEHLRLGRRAITDAAGVAPSFYRPPYGIFNLAAWVEAARLGMRRTLWSASSGDWKASATSASITERTLAAAQPGAIILMHDAGGWPDRPFGTLQALPDILAGLREKGLKAVSLSQLLSGI
jgi:peptidoglycan/xylan/chitin deacetylase (PgdA/CDA1 family)